MTEESLAKAWIKSLSFPVGSLDGEEFMWASDELLELASRSPTKCWDFVLEILSLSDDGWVLENLGAGPIEHMLDCNSEISIILIEKEFPKNNKLQVAVSHVWQNIVPDRVWNRQQALL